MEIQTLRELFQSFGFPVMVAGYVLVRMENTMKELVKAVTELNANVLLLVKNK